MGGWNIHLLTQRFRFAPAHASDKARGGQGHAHLYIDGEKHTRLYGPWYYLPEDALAPGRHTLKVTLNANDHSIWAVDGEPVQATTRITATNTGKGHHHTGAHGHASVPPTSPSPAASADEVIKVRLTAGTVHPAPRRVEVDRGDRVSLIVTGDQANTVHVHGYGKEAPLEPAQAATIEFVASRTGVFEIETHDPALQLLQLQVQ